MRKHTIRILLILTAACTLSSGLKVGPARHSPLAVKPVLSATGPTTVARQRFGYSEFPGFWHEFGRRFRLPPFEQRRIRREAEVRAV